MRSEGSEAVWLFLALILCGKFVLGITNIRGGMDSHLVRQETTTTVHHDCRVNFEERRADCKDKGLADVPQDLNRDIQHLDLSFNNLTILRNASFQKYSSLTDLNLGYNSIRTVQIGAFYPLIHLRSLVLRNNEGISVHRACYERLCNLKSLNLDGCGLSHFFFQLVERNQSEQHLVTSQKK